MAVAVAVAVVAVAVVAVEHLVPAAAVRGATKSPGAGGRAHVPLAQRRQQAMNGRMGGQSHR